MNSPMKSKTLANAGWKIVLTLTGLVFLAFTIAACCNWRAAIDPATAGTLGASFIPVSGSRYAIAEIAEYSPLKTLGAKVGDEVVFQDQSDMRRALRIGEAIPVTLKTSGVERAVTLSAVPAPELATDGATFTMIYIVGAIIALFTWGLSMAIGLRLSDSIPMRAFSLALLGLSTDFMIGALPASPLAEWVVTYFAPFSYATIVTLFLYFSLSFPEQQPWFRKPWVRFGFAALTACIALMVVLTLYDRASGLPPTAASVVRRARNLLVVIACSAVMLALYNSWRHSSGAMRQRMAWIGACLSGIVFGYWINNLIAFLYWNTDSFGLTFGLYVFTTAILAVATAGFGYAVLRHQLLNIQFVINRTLVFAVTSVLLFVSFWLIEQGVHKLVHFEAAQNNALLGGAIAFALFYSFNRLHHKVEKWIEELFFRHWRAKEHALRSFMSKVPHFVDIDALIVAFGGALDRFSDHSGCAMYLLTDEPQFQRVFSSMSDAATCLPIDNDIAVTCRDTRKPIRLDDVDRAVPGAIAFPMMQGNELKGFVVLGAKVGVQTYRPDEEKILQAAVELISLDLSRLHAEQLAKVIKELQTERTLLLNRQGFLEHELSALHLTLSSAISRVG
jgi:hypothetical protein